MRSLSPLLSEASTSQHQGNVPSRTRIPSNTWETRKAAWLLSLPPLPLNTKLRTRGTGHPEPDKLGLTKRVHGAVGRRGHTQPVARRTSWLTDDPSRPLAQAGRGLPHKNTTCGATKRHYFWKPQSPAAEPTVRFHAVDQTAVSSDPATTLPSCAPSIRRLYLGRSCNS